MAISTSAPDRASSHQTDEALRAKQIEQAEELLFSGQDATGFAKALFRGEFRGNALFPYPELPEKERATVERAAKGSRRWAIAGSWR
jgi:acyl-CoA dehydrogenase family protein 9